MAADLGIDAAIGQQIGALRRQQEMIDADAVIAVPGAGLIIPEGIMAGALDPCPEGLGKAQIDDAAEGGAVEIRFAVWEARYREERPEPKRGLERLAG